MPDMDGVHEIFTGRGGDDFPRFVYIKLPKEEYVCVE